MHSPSKLFTLIGAFAFSLPATGAVAQEKPACHAPDPTPAAAKADLSPSHLAGAAFGRTHHLLAAICRELRGDFSRPAGSALYQCQIADAERGRHTILNE